VDKKVIEIPLENTAWPARAKETSEAFKTAKEIPCA
jgi:hypothetical protein